ncbi:MAG: hypothetical protein U0939_22595 [Pirellulales bacterium]
MSQNGISSMPSDKECTEVSQKIIGEKRTRQWHLILNTTGLKGAIAQVNSAADERAILVASAISAEKVTKDSDDLQRCRSNTFN